MVTLAEELVVVTALRPTVTELTLGEMQGVGVVVGPHRAKVTVPLGAPPLVVPVTVAVSVAVFPNATLGLLSDVVNVGVVVVGAVLVTSRHSVEVLLSVAEV